MWRVDASAELLGLTSEAEWFLVDGVPLEVDESSVVMRIGEAGEDGCGLEMPVRGRRPNNSEPDNQRNCSNQFFLMPQGIRSLRSRA